MFLAKHEPLPHPFSFEPNKNRPIFAPCGWSRGTEYRTKHCQAIMREFVGLCVTVTVLWQVSSRLPKLRKTACSARAVARRGKALVRLVERVVLFSLMLVHRTFSLNLSTCPVPSLSPFLPSRRLHKAIKTMLHSKNTLGLTPLLIPERERERETERAQTSVKACRKSFSKPSKKKLLP